MTIALSVLDSGSIKPVAGNKQIWQPELDKAKRMAKKLGLSIDEALSISRSVARMGQHKPMN